jgi:protein-S-isoprenylcysteine O-methyltransferase Ste14
LATAKACRRAKQNLSRFIRIMFYGAVCASVFYFAQTPISPARAITSIFFLLIGGGLAFAATFDLGWKRAFGDNQGLRRDGIFRYSRNPIYVASWFGLAG